MITFPNAKINIGLFITGKRPDGYHNIESIFYPVPLCDALEIVPAESTRFISSGLSIPGDSEQNLVWRAYELLSNKFPGVKPLDIYLQKHIPMGAGLGGGSADGAFMINLMNDFFNLNLSESQRMDFAAELGSDCPFFIRNKPAFVWGRGEFAEPHNLDLTGWHLVLVNPGIHVSTSEAYGSISPGPAPCDLKKLSADDLKSGAALPANQFEAGITKKHPEILSLKNGLLDAGANYASMTGSGSTVFGLFTGEPPRKWPQAWYLRL